MRITVAAATAFLVLFFGARAAAAPQQLEYASYADPAVALGSSGRAVSLLSDGFQSRLVVRLARPGRRFGRPRVVPASVSRPGRALPIAVSATIGASGRAVLLWTADDESRPAVPSARDEGCCRRLWAAVVDEAGRLRRGSRLSAGAVEYFPYRAAHENLAVVRGSRAAVAWRDRGELRVAVAGARGRFGRPWRIRTGARLISVHLVRGSPRVVVLDDATNVVSELRRVRGRTRRVRLATLATLEPYTDVRAASTAVGHLLLVRQGYDRRRRERFLEVGYRRPGGQLRVATVRFRGLSAAFVPARPALAPNGRGLIVAARRSGLVFLPVGGRGQLGRPRSLPQSRPSDLSSSLAVRAGSSGSAVVAGTRYTNPGARAVAWRVRLGGTSTRRGFPSPNAVNGINAGIDRVGRALVAWSRPRGVYVERLP